MDKNIKEILRFIGKNVEGASFYQIVRGFGFPDAPYDLRATLRSFVDDHLVEMQQEDSGVNARYIVTKKGLSALAEPGS
jgi:hypothetical protein